MSYLAVLPDERRRRIRVYTGHFPYAAREILGGDIVTVTILRDPVKRTISLLRQFRRKAPWARRARERDTGERRRADERVAAPPDHRGQRD